MADTTTVVDPAAAPAPMAGRSLWQDAWRRLRRNRAAVASAALLLFFAFAGNYLTIERNHQTNELCCSGLPTKAK